MNIFKNLDSPFQFKNPVVAVGAFDGVHLGHRKILQQVVALAKQNNGESVIVTFDPHPRQLLHPADDFFILNTLEKKLQLLEENLVDNVIVIPFTKEFAEHSYTEFLQQIIIAKIHTKILVMGPNHNFGKNRAGNFANARIVCQKNGIQIEEIPEFVLTEIAVRSSAIRKLLIAGEKEKAEELLGYPL